MKVAELSRLGFVCAGTCVLDTQLKSGVRFTTTHLKNARVIYAFAVGEEVKYIGVCDNSSTSFADRMSRYQGMMGAGTNKRIAGQVKTVLLGGSTVSILAWQPEQELRVGDLRVDLVKGLENPLIGLAKPEWNIHS